MGGRGGSGGIAKAANAIMPDLQGSPKQVSWAEQIRRDALRAADSLISNYRSLQNRNPKDKNFAEDTLRYTPQDAKVVVEFVAKQFYGMKSASTIINSRNRIPGQKEMEEMARDVYKKRKNK